MHTINSYNSHNGRLSASNTLTNSNAHKLKSASTDYSNNVSPKNSQKINSNSKSVEFNEPDKSVCKILLTELRNIKQCLIDSSKDIEKVFKVPFSHLSINVSTI
jgi:hypothetical protein